MHFPFQTPFPLLYGLQDIFQLNTAMANAVNHQGVWWVAAARVPVFGICFVLLHPSLFVCLWMISKGPAPAAATQRIRVTPDT